MGRSRPEVTTQIAQLPQRALNTRPLAPSTVTHLTGLDLRAWRPARRPPPGCRTRGPPRRRASSTRPSPSPGRRRSGTAGSSPDRSTGRPGSRPAPGGRRPGSRTTRAGPVTVPAEAGLPTRAPSGRASVRSASPRLGAVGRAAPAGCGGGAARPRTPPAAPRTTIRRPARRRARAGPRRRSRKKMSSAGPMRPGSASGRPTTLQLGAERPRGVRPAGTSGVSRSPISCRARRRAKPTTRPRSRSGPRRAAGQLGDRSPRASAAAPRRTARSGARSGSSSRR